MPENLQKSEKANKRNSNRGHGERDLPVIKHAHGKDGARIIDFPSILLVPLGVKIFGDSSSPDPFLTVLGDAVGIGTASTTGDIVHWKQVIGANDSQF